MTFSSWSIKRDTFPFFVCWPALTNDVWGGNKWPQLRIKVIKRQFKTIIGSVIPQLICLRACVSRESCSYITCRISAGKKKKAPTHMWLSVRSFINLLTYLFVYLLYVTQRERKRRKSMVLLCAHPGPCRSPRTRSVYCAQKKAITMLMCRSRGVNPPHRTWKVDGESRVTVG